MKDWCTYSALIIGLAIAADAGAVGIGDTIVQLSTVTVDTIRTHRSIGVPGHTQSLAEFDNVDGRKASEVLAEFSGVYLKNYGVGQLSSVSLRGGSAAQTELQWNGVKLNNPNTGQVDLALFDLGAGDRLRVADAGVYGAGISGIIAIDNQIKTQDNRILCSDNTIRIGSFGEHVISSYNTYRFGKFQGATRVGYLGADNDFSFEKYSQQGAGTVRQINAATRLLSAMQQFVYSFHYPIVVRADFWVTDADRQLPPVMTASSSVERQWDRSYRTMLNMAGSKGRLKYELKSAYLYDRLRYVDSSAAIESRSVSHALRNIFDIRYEFRQHISLTGKAHYDREIALSSGYDHRWTRDLAGGGVEALYGHKSGFSARANVGLEALQGHLLPIPAQVGLGFMTKFHQEGLTLLLSGAHAYRVPGMNDLYWSTGGNPTLRPEKAWKGDLHIGFCHSYWFSLMVDGFYHYLNDWIQWSPSAGSNVWSAQNLKRVLSRGLTTGVRMQSRRNMSDKGAAASGDISYTYTNTISLDPISVNDNSIGKQLIYVPLHNLVASVRVQYRYFYIRIAQTYTGQRYVATDNSQYLKPYFLTHLEIGKDIYWQGQRIGLSFRVNNITGQQYQLVSQRPMPGRSFEGTIRVNLTK